MYLKYAYYGMAHTNQSVLNPIQNSDQLVCYSFIIVVKDQQMKIFKPTGWESNCAPSRCKIFRLSLAAAGQSSVIKSVDHFRVPFWVSFISWQSRAEQSLLRQNTSKWLENSWKNGEVQCVKWRSEVRNVKQTARLEQLVFGRRGSVLVNAKYERKVEADKKWWWLLIGKKTDTWETYLDTISFFTSLNVRQVGHFSSDCHLTVTAVNFALLNSFSMVALFPVLFFCFFLCQTWTNACNSITPLLHTRPWRYWKRKYPKDQGGFT